MATVTDAPKIAELQLSNWQHTHPAIAQRLNRENVQSQWAHAITLQEAGGRVLVCESDGALVGVAAIEFEQEIGHLSLLEVAPEFRRQLFGSRLLNAVADIAHKTGCLQLRTWLNEDQKEGKLFLESIGWAATGATRTVSTETAEIGTPELTDHQIELTTSLAT